MRFLLAMALLMTLAASAAPTHFDSTPPGAVVYDGDTRIGVTPCDAEIPVAGRSGVRFRFEKDGFETVILSYPPMLSNQTVKATLHRSTALQTAIVVVLLAGAASVAVIWLVRRSRAVHQVIAQAEATPVNTDMAGTCLGPYLLTERLGHGGAGEVYRGTRQDGLDPTGQVAIKVVRVQHEERHQAEQRLAREVELLQRLQHPAIVRYLDVGRAGDVLYLVEELLPGGDLEAMIPPGGMDPARFVEVFVPLLDGMAFAHGRGVVHRDLKPSNVLFTIDGRPKVSDFGLARGADSATLTTNNCMGTPLYMAPELFSGTPATPLSDEYALGVMAYEMLSGTVPFSGDSIMELVAQRIKPPPRLSERMQHPLPGGLEQVVMRMLAIDPKDRFPSLEAVREALMSVACSGG